MIQRNQEGTANPNWKGGKVKKICPTCKTEFEKWPSYKSIYCSRKCHTKIGDKNPKWHGGFLISGGYKYVYTPKHPSATQMGYVLEHRLVMEKVLGRTLKTEELVHHLNHNKLDNRPENLHLCSNSQHSTLHMKSRIRDELGRLTPCIVCGEHSH